jgi:hypothetical protein
MSRTAVYGLLHRGEFASVEIPSGNRKRATRRIEQAEVDAFIARYRVSTPEMHGGVL